MKAWHSIVGLYFFGIKFTWGLIMDPVTHMVIGIALYKMGGQPMTIQNPTLLGAILGAVIPDIDIVLQKWGDYIYLKHHRGASHSIIGLAVFSTLITVVLLPLYKHMNFLNVLIWTFLGCVSHSAVDMLNSYGAEFLWPFYKKKISFGLLIIFDPILFVLLLLYDFCSMNSLYNILGKSAFIAYFAFRVLMFLGVEYKLRKYFGVERRSINVAPTIAGLFKWHFIVTMPSKTVVGEKSIFNKKVKIVKELIALEKELNDKVSNTTLAQFFQKFTPFSHILWDEGKRIFKFIDVRYYMKNNFLHHATIKVDEDYNVLEQKFHPYSINKNVDVPK